MAENIDVNVNVNTSQANRNLDNLNNRIGALSKSFSALKTALGGIAFGAFINNSLRFAASMVDVSNSTDIALEAVVGFSRAVQDNGGNLADAQNALQKFNISIAEAAEGSAGAQDAFRKVGVSLNDLRTLSQQDLLQKTIQGLAKITDASLRAKLQTELLGKAFRGVDVQGLANDYDTAVKGSIAYIQAIKTADQVQNNLEKAITDLQIALLAVLEPVGDLAKNISTNIDAIVKWTKVIFEFLLVLGQIFVVGKIIGLFIKLAQVVKTLWQSFSLLGSMGRGLIDIFKLLFDPKLVDKIIAIAQRGGKAGEVALAIGAALSKFATAAGNAALAVAGFLASLLGLDKAYQAYKSMQEDFSKPLVIQGEGARAIPEGFFEKRREQIRQVEEALIKEKNAIQEVTAAYQDSVAEQIAAINIQRLSIDMSRDEVEVMNAVDEVIKRNTDAIKKLEDQKASLASDSPLIPAIDAEIEILKKSLETDKRVTAEAVRNLQKRQLEQEKLTHVIEQTNIALSQGGSLQALQDQLSLVGQYGEELENNLVRLDVQRELESTLNALAVRALELQQQRIQLGEQRYQQEMNNLLALTNAAYTYADARLEAEKKILDAQRATQENAKLGVENAIADIAKQFEPYTMAQDAVKQGWSRVSDAIDKFVETGKFSFSDFARSVIQDLAKMIAKAMIFKAISAALGAFGLSIPGLASGGPAKGGQPYIVGEKGPELFVPQGSGTVVPNNQLGKNGVASGAVSAPVTNNYNTYNINALDAKSVATLFAENRKAIFGANKMAEREMSYAGAR